MMESQAELKQIGDYLAAQDDVRLAIVYGSLATGRARLDSDLDIAVAGDQTLDASRKMALMRGLAGVCGRAIDLVDQADSLPYRERLLADRRKAWSQ